VVSFKMSEFFLLNSFGSHLDDFSHEGLSKGNIYVFGDEEGTLIFPEEFSDLLNLARTDISEVNEDYLFVLSKKGI